jgi:AP-3 complex subunit beta
MIHSLDHDTKDQLIEVIKTLLDDKSTMVLGSAVAAYEEVCPERYDLIHPNYRQIELLII